MLFAYAETDENARSLGSFNLIQNGHILFDQITRKSVVFSRHYDVVDWGFIDVAYRRKIARLLYYPF